MRFLAWVAVIGVFAVVGCQKHGTPSAPQASNTGLGIPPGAGVPNGQSPFASADPTQPAAGGTSAAPLGSPNNLPGPGSSTTSASVQKLAAALRHPPAQIEKPGSGGWHTGSMKPLELAKTMDSAFYHLDGGLATFRVHYILPIGEGTSLGSAKIKNDKTFAVRYPVIEGDPPHPQVIESRGNAGKHVFFHPTATKTDKDAYGPVEPFHAGGSEDGGNVLAHWSTDMPSLSMSHFVSGRDVYAPLVGALTASGSGYKVSCEERTVNYQGRNIKNYRIVATRTDGPKTDEIEIVVDANKFVPVTMRTRKSAPGQKSAIVEWAGSWQGGKFGPRDFELPSS